MNRRNTYLKQQNTNTETRSYINETKTRQGHVEPMFGFQDG